MAFEKKEIELWNGLLDLTRRMEVGDAEALNEIASRLAAFTALDVITDQQRDYIGKILKSKLD